MNHWIQAARPKTLAAIVGPLMIATAMSLRTQSLNPIVLAVIIFCGLCIQIGTNFANDYFDYIKGADTSDRKGPTRVVSAGLIKPQQMLLATCLVFSLAIVGMCYLTVIGGPVIGVLSGFAVLFGITYTAGPYPIAYLGLGELFVVLFFGIVAVSAPVYILSGQWSSLAFIAGIGPGLLSTALLVVNNLRDIDEDKACGKKTLTVRFGRAFAKSEFAICLILPALLPVYFVTIGQAHAVLLLTSIYTSTSFPLIKNIFTANSTDQYSPLFSRIGRLIFGYSLLFALGWLV